MTEIFGHKWTANFGKEPNPSWVSGLSDMTTEDIQRGISSLVNWKDEGGWPPTLLQFRELCRPHAAPAHRRYVPLPEPKTAFEIRQETAARAFKALRDGPLKQAIAARNNRLSDADRELLEKLDWEKIRQASTLGNQQLATTEN